ncbi:MAG: dihydroorotase family protein, partial [Candidatus Nanohaloarchaea archaeon]|nr:dihydroorotase family protein [Candidatus Nanohaloarchaea archaeon]
MTVLRNGRVYIDGGLRDIDLRFDTHIRDIGDGLASGTEDVIDCENALVLPGGVDPHVHFRDFRQDHKEDWTTGSAAALAGGTTTVMDMPNTDPPVLDTAQADAKRRRIADAPVAGFVYGGIGPSNRDTLAEFAA